MEFAGHDLPADVVRVLSQLPGLAYFRQRSLGNPRWPEIRRTRYILERRLGDVRQPGSALNSVVDEAIRLWQQHEYERVPGAVDEIIAEAERLWGVKIRPKGVSRA